MTDIKRTMIASLLIEQATELKGKRPTELGFEDLVDVVQGVVKKCSIPAVVGQSEQLVCEHKYQDNVCDWRGVRKCIICGQMEKAN